MYNNKISRVELHKKSIIPSKQKGKSGCMWHSIYSLTQNRDFLMYIDDNPSFRFMLITQSFGYLLWPLLIMPKEILVTKEIWEELYKRCHNEKAKLKLLLSVRMNLTEDHMIAIEADFENNIMKLMDPQIGEIQKFEWETIITLEYQRIYEIFVLDSGELSDYPKIRA